MDEIQFDEMEVDTDLAEEYFEKNNYTFPNDPELRRSQYTKDGYGNTILFHDCQPVYGYLIDPVVKLDKCQLQKKLLKLVEEVEKNAEKISQIEYLVRDIPINEVRDYDIKLIVQNLSRGVSSLSNYYTRAKGVIYMNKNTMLADLGYVAQALTYHEDLVIICTKNTAAVTHLFVELCHSVGLDSVKLCSAPCEGYPYLTSDSIVAFSTGCIGVVTERCDVDSAIDIFLQSTTRYPWKLSRIFVEESVYDSFLKAIAWKASLKRVMVAPDMMPATKYCTDAFAYDGKTFLVNFAGDAEKASAGILVEAYRTTKELVSLVKKNRAMFLSLWASDVSQANEIAYNVPSSIVWINGYGVFDGPPQSSQAIFSELLLANADRNPCAVGSYESLLRRQEAWANLTFEERRKIVQKETDEFLIDSNDEGMVQFLKQLRSALQNIESKNFVRVDKDHMCVGISVPIKATYISITDKSDVYDSVDLIANFLTIGSAIVYEAEPELSLIKKFFERLATKIPITLTDSSDDKVEVHDVKNSPLMRTKVVWTSFGTTFAN